MYKSLFSQSEKLFFNKMLLTFFRYRCYWYNSHFCRAYLVKFRGEYMETGRPHTHGNDRREINALEFKNFCKNQARETIQPYRAIYNRASEM